ncbi:MAG: hypothetical protein K6G26_02480 [Lachnospiraceae bacterium]|nr:hypothetical protein [Lachnospiraceae bacterium]
MFGFNFKLPSFDRDGDVQAGFGGGTLAAPFAALRHGNVRKIEEKQEEVAAEVATEVAVQQVKQLPSVNFNPDKKLDARLDKYEEMRIDAEGKSNSLDERTRTVERKRCELNEGLGMLPSNIPEEFQKAVNQACDSARAALVNEAKEIKTANDDARIFTDNVIYEVRKELEYLHRKVHRYEMLSHIPFIGNYSSRRYDVLFEKSERLQKISDSANIYYDNLLYGRNILLNIIQ